MTNLGHKDGFGRLSLLGDQTHGRNPFVEQVQFAISVGQIIQGLLQFHFSVAHFFQ